MCLNLDEFGEFDGREYDGLLGMDVLRSFVVQFDFDRGVLRFLASVPENAGTRIPLIPDSSTCPAIEANVCGLGLIPFVIDTGCNQSITLDRSDFTLLLRDGQIGSHHSVARNNINGAVRSDDRIC